MGLGDTLEQTGKVMLPRSCLMMLSHLGDLPDTMLLRINHRSSSAYVGVADFIDDQAAFDATSAGGHSVPRWGNPFVGGIGALFVPRWVRSQLAVSNGDELGVALVSLPKAAGMVLTPHTDAFAEALAKTADPRQVLTELFNRYVAAAEGDTIHLVVPKRPCGDDGEAEQASERHALDVSAIRGLPGVRCGLPSGAPQILDVGAALRGVSGDQDPIKGVGVRAACLVDADVQCDFNPSLETLAREAREAKALEEAVSWL